MTKWRALALFVVLGFSWILAGGSQKKQQEQATQRLYGNQKDALDKYTLDRLYEVLKKRGNKSVYSDEPEDLKDIPSSVIADNVIQREKTIYGPDRRKDFFEIQDPEILQAANSVAAMIPMQYLQSTTGGFQISQSCPTLGGKYHLCSKESYVAQPVPSICSAFVVGPDVIATAGHCVPWLGTSRIVFRFREEGTAAHAEIHTIPTSQVYKPMQVLAQKVDKVGADFALVRVDRTITPEHPPLKLHTDGDVAMGSLVYVLGHPSGLPLKLADSALVSEIVPNGYFLSNLDTFGGNSGSPVFNAGTNMVEGILVRGGQTDYQSEGTCNKAFVCPLQPDGSKDCSGESSTLMSQLSEPLQKIGSTAQKSTSTPIVKTYRSGPKQSGLGANFSPVYELDSEEAPPGYKIGVFTSSLVGDRGCNAWSTCNTVVVGNKVVFRFSLQGHNEWFPPRIALTEGVLTVTFVPVD
jgi:Trypsin-like peptidase domain